MLPAPTSRGKVRIAPLAGTFQVANTYNTNLPLPWLFAEVGTQGFSSREPPETTRLSLPQLHGLYNGW